MTALSDNSPKKSPRGTKTTLQKAKAIYDWVCKNMYRDSATIGCQKGDACLLPQAENALIFTRYLLLFAGQQGYRPGKADVQDIGTWQNCWAELYLPGYGWMPVDPADVRKIMLKKHLGLEDQKSIAPSATSVKPGTPTG